MAGYKMVATKFTDTDGIEKIRSGSFKVGSLSEYRRIEAGHQKKALTLDETEGVDDVNIIAPRAQAINIHTEELQITGLKSYGCTLPNQVSTIFDRWVFCAAMGDYDEDLHRNEIIRRKKDFTEYAILDWRKFVEALLSEAIRRFPFKVHRGRSGPVVYTKRELDVLYSEAGHALSEHETAERCDKLTFTKPASFQGEKEGRLMLIPPDGVSYASEYQKVFFKSDALKNSIIRTGRLTK